jgi:hypothetical protein
MTTFTPGRHKKRPARTLAFMTTLNKKPNRSIGISKNFRTVWFIPGSGEGSFGFEVAMILEQVLERVNVGK